MKKLFVLPLIVTLLLTNALSAQKQSAIYKIGQDGDIVILSSMIEGNCLNDDVDLHLHRTLDSIFVGETVYGIEVATCIYDELKSGFHMIKIDGSNGKSIKLEDLDMWTYTYDGECEQDFRQYTDNRYFIPLDLNATTKALCFVGWPYGGDLPYLTIIVLTEKDVKTVFHKHVDISQITKVNGEYNIKIQTVLEEYDSSGVLCTAPEFGKIFSKEGILYIEGFEIK